MSSSDLRVGNHVGREFLLRDPDHGLQLETRLERVRWILRGKEEHIGREKFVDLQLGECL